ncbi:MAG: SseB family protein, partial [Pseudonocardiaceae bacterium]
FTRTCSIVGLMTSSTTTEPEIVRIARDVRALRREPAEFDAAFALAAVFARRTTGERPGVMVSSLPGKGSWVLAFSTPERLAAFGQDKPWLRTTGADLLAQLPPGIGVLFDVGEDHGLPLLPQPHGPARFASAVLPGTGRGWSRLQ